MKCKEEVWSRDRWSRKYQCSFNAKKDGYCHIHHPDAVKAREEKSQKRFEESMARSPHARLKRALDRIKELESRNQWQPIETAPKDGRVLLLGRFNSHKMWRTLRGQWFTQQDIDEEWEEHHECFEGWYETSVEADDLPNVWQTSPTHWMPLPEAP